MNQLAYGQRINIPTSIMRSVSFQKVRQGSLSSRNITQNKKQPEKAQAITHQHISQQHGINRVPTLCERLIMNKLKPQPSTTVGSYGVTSSNNYVNNNNKNAYGNAQYNKNTLNKPILSFQQRAILIKKQQQQKQLRQCTFMPKVNKPSINNDNLVNNNVRMRTVEEFVDQHMQYQKYKSDKVNEMRQMIQAKINKENTFQPNINNPHHAYHKKSVGLVHQRLYEQGIKKQQSKQNIMPQSIQKRSKLGSKQKLTTFSRKNSQKSLQIGSSSIVTAKIKNKNDMVTENDLSQFTSNMSQALQTNNKKQAFNEKAQMQAASVINSSKKLFKNITMNNKNNNYNNQISHQKYKNVSHSNTSRQSSRQNSRNKCQKGLKTVVTKNMNVEVQDMFDRKVSKSYKNQDKQSRQCSSHVSLKNRELFIKKILRQIGSILSDSQIAQSDLTYSQMTTILQRMNFLVCNNSEQQRTHTQENQQNHLNSYIGNSDYMYSQEIWQMLQGDIYESCPLANLIRIIYCLLGCYQFSIIEQGLATVMPQSCAAKRLVLNEREAKGIKYKFQQLSLNRLRKGQYVSNIPRAQGYSFKPTISKNSEQFAQKYRQRMLLQSQQLSHRNLINFQVDQNKKVGHVDLLLLDEKRKEAKIYVKRQQAQRERKRLEDQSMQGNKDKQKKNYNTSQSIEARFQYLYEAGKNTIRSKNQKNYSSSSSVQKQCTFHPNVGRSKHSNTNSNNNSISSKQRSRQVQQHNSDNVQQMMVNQTQRRAEHQKSISNFESSASNNDSLCNQNRKDKVRDFDRTVFRMYEARRIRQEGSHLPSRQQQLNSKLDTDRSVVQSQTHRSRYHRLQQHEQQDPFLYLNVCMEGASDIKVPVFHSDNMRTITHKVKILMGLQNAEDQKLEQILRLQILPTLESIGLQMDMR